MILSENFCPAWRIKIDELFLVYQERLRSHAQAFNGLLSLIPAKVYYGEDNSVRLPKIFASCSATGSYAVAGVPLLPALSAVRLHDVD